MRSSASPRSAPADNKRRIASSSVPRDCFASLAMTRKGPVIARSGATKQSRSELYPAADTGSKADVIVVLGCQLFPGGRPSERLRRRVALGVGLYREGAAPLLVMSGGGAGAVTEAAAMRDL